LSVSLDCSFLIAPSVFSQYWRGKQNGQSRETDK
jgi:hypothetical protein